MFPVTAHGLAFDHISFSAEEDGCRVAPPEGGELLDEVEGIDKQLARELTPHRLEILRQILHGGKVKPRLVSVTPFSVSLFAETYIEEFSSFNKLYETALTEFVTGKEKAKRERW